MLQFCSLLFFCPKLLFRGVTPFTIISFLVKAEAKVSDLLIEVYKFCQSLSPRLP